LKTPFFRISVWRAYDISISAIWWTYFSWYFIGYLECEKKVKAYVETQKKLAVDKLAAQYGYHGLNPGMQLFQNNAYSGTSS
jgi:hypothetical protein